MSDAREALVALILERFRAAETYMDLPRQAGLLADAIQSAGWTPPGERVKPSVEVGVCEHQNANYLRMMSERDALRAEVERLRAVSAAQPYETERELAVALDEARQMVADLRAGIIAAVTVLNREFYRRPAAWVERLAADLRALLAGSGEQPGEDRGPVRDGWCCWTCADLAEAAGPAPVTPAPSIPTLTGRASTGANPAPVVPDSADVRNDRADTIEKEADRAS